MWYLKRFYGGFYSRHKTFWDTKKNREKKFQLVFSFNMVLGREGLSFESNTFSWSKIKSSWICQNGQIFHFVYLVHS